MDESQQDLYEERLKEVFHSFDASGAGSLSPEELTDLCQSLQLQEAEPTLLNTLLQNQDQLTGRVDFEQFKNALILVLSSTIGNPAESEEVAAQSDDSPPDSPEVHPKFVKGTKRYGRRSTPEFIEGLGEFSAAASEQEGGPSEGQRAEEEEDEEDEENEESAVPRKRERWNTHGSSPEEYEAEGQLHLWNPDEPGTPRGSMCMPISERQEERLHAACAELALPWDQPATQEQLFTLCQHLGLELNDDLLQCLDVEGDMNVLDFMRYIISQSQPPTPSSSTPYRQLKRHHSTQPFDESGRRTSIATSTIGLRLFSTLDDGTGHTAAEELVDAWMDEGIENSPEVLEALEFSLDGRVNLSELTMALENELMMTTKNNIHRAALASFKAEIRHLVERVDLELREKEKIRSDLEKAEKLKSQLASEVDEHHFAIERHNEHNLRKLELEHKEKLAALRSELTREMDRLQQQASQQREELEAEIVKIREDETFLREHLSLTAKENSRLEAELLDSTERLVEAENQVSKLQKNLDNVLKEKFGDLDPGSAEFFLQEDRLRHLRSNYELQCRELQDRIDELQAQLEEFQVVGRAPPPSSLLSLSDELENKSPGMESDQGLGLEESQPFNMSLETEMLLERLKEQHFREMESIKEQVSEYQQRLEEQQAVQDELRSTLSSQHQEEVQALRDEVALVLSRAHKLQNQLDQVEEERMNLEENQVEEREALERQHQERMSSLQHDLEESLAQAGELQEQLKTVEARHADAMDELEKEHSDKIHQLEQQQEEAFKTRIEEERQKLQGDREEEEKRILDKWEQEREQLQKSHEEDLVARLEEAKRTFEEDSKDLQRRLTEEWEQEKGQLEGQHKEVLEALLVEEGMRLLKEQEQKEAKLREQWEEEQALLEEQHEASLQDCLAKERERLRDVEEEIERRLSEEFEKEKSQLEEQYECELQERLEEERVKHRQEKEEVERRWQDTLEEEKARLEESNREAIQELSSKHSEERERLSGLLDKLRDDIALERRELESHFSQRITEVEARFSGDQEAVSERFQADVHSLEQHYQSELQALSKHHTEERTNWEAEMEAANQEAENQLKVLKETLQLEKETFTQELSKEREDLEQHHKGEMEALRLKNQELQNELESFISAAQTKEIELSRQLNELHDRLQENLDAKDELLAQSERKALEVELLLRQAANDFEQERTDLQASLSDLESRHVEALNLAETQLEERRHLLEERDQLKAKVQEVEQLLRQAAEDFENERLEMQCSLMELEEKLKEAQAAATSMGEKTNELGDLDLELDVVEESSPNVEERTTTESFEICDEKADLVAEMCEGEEIIILSNDFEVPEGINDDDVEKEASCDLPVFAVPIPEETDEELAKENCDADMQITVSEVAHDEEEGTDETEADGNDADAIVQEDPTEEGDLSANTDEKDVVDVVNDADEVISSTDDGLTETTGDVEGYKEGAEEENLVDPDEGADLHPAEPADGKDAESATVADSQETEDAEFTVLTEKNEIIDTDIYTEDDQVDLSGVSNVETKENVEEAETVDGGVIEVVEAKVEDEEVAETGAEIVHADAAEPEGGQVEVSEDKEVDVVQVLEVDVVDVSVEIVEAEVTVATDTDPVHVEEVEHNNVSTRADVEGMETDKNEGECVALNEPDSANAGSRTGADVEDTGAYNEDTGVDMSDLGADNADLEGTGIVADVGETRQVVENMGEVADTQAEVEDMSVEVVDNEMPNEVPASNPDAEIINTEGIVIQVTEENKEEGADLDAAGDIEPTVEDMKIIEQASVALLLERMKELEREAELVAKLQEDCALAVKERDACVQEILELQDRVGQFQDQTRVLAHLQAQYKAATEDNQSLQQQVSQLQQRTNELEVILEVNSESLITGQEALVENCDLKSEISTMIEQVKNLEIKALELTDLQIRYEECICENVRLADHNEKLEKRVVSLEGKMHIIQEFHDQHSALLDEIGRMREENTKLSAVVHELEKQDDEDVNDLLQAMQQESSDSSGNTSDSDTFLDLNSQMEAKIQAVSDLEECCSEFEKQNAKLRRALTELQEKSFHIRNRMQAHRSEAGRLAEENIVLRHKISAIKEEDVRESQEDMLIKLELFRKEKVAAQKMAESFKKQISELRMRGLQLEEENGLLSQKNDQNAADVQELSVHLGDLIRHSERREAGHQRGTLSAREREEMEACVTALESELTKAQEESAILQHEKALLSRQLSSLHGQLKEGGDLASALSRAQRLQEEKELLKEELDCCVEKVAKLGALEGQLAHLLQERQTAEKQVHSLRSQLSKAQEKNQALESTLQMVNLQTSRLKSDLRVTQQERDTLKQEVMSLHQKLQNANDKVQLLEVSLQASGFPAPQRQLLSGELRRLLEQDQQLLQQENERLLREVQHAKGELQNTREKTRQLESTVVSLKQRQQQSQAGLLKVVEQEKASLKRELDALRNELLSAQNKVCEHNEEQRQLETLRQENSALKSRQTHLEAQLLEALQVQLGGILPQSPVRLPGERRGQHRGDDHGPDFNIQGAVMAEPRGAHSDSYRRSGGL
ncbi:ninein isoform X2 [Alosa sapidissima]|uniref:ninein isoform X2 n=1 Tax=Alosa sapidissima TaxID=34773 RepID=UPI001C0A1FC9|nr:ninein isoform X2 [Alosa sapidissima]